MLFEHAGVEVGISDVAGVGPQVTCLRIGQPARAVLQDGRWRVFLGEGEGVEQLYPDPSIAGWREEYTVLCEALIAQARDGRLAKLVLAPR